MFLPYLNGKKHYGDDFVANYAGYEKGVEDYSEFIRDDLRHILAIRSRGKMRKPGRN